MSESPYFLIDTDRFTRKESKAGNIYYKFNLYIRDRNNPPIWEGLLMGWRFQDGKLMPPFVGNFGRFYNSMYISNTMAEAIYRHVVELVSTIEDVPVVAKPWDAAVVYPKNFVKMMPEFHKKHFSSEKVIRKKVDGPVLQLFKNEEPAAIEPVGPALVSKKVAEEDEIPYPNHYTLRQMMDKEQRPSYISKHAAAITGPTDNRLGWSKSKWLSWEAERKERWGGSDDVATIVPKSAANYGFLGD